MGPSRFGIGLLALSSLSRAVLARECIIDEILTVSSPQDLDSLRDGCTTITGNIAIDSDYSGDFFLEGVSDFVGNISTSEDAPPVNLGVLDLPDLVNAAAITVHRVETVNLGNLQHAGELLLGPSSPDGEVNLEALKDADNVGFKGGWKSIVLSSLETVTGELGFYFVRGDDVFPDDDEIPSLVVDLPVLKTTSQFTVEGKVASISVPELDKAGDTDTPERDSSQGLRLNIETQIEVEFPKLQTIGATTQVFGNLSRISLPALGETATGMEFNTDMPLEIYSTIETAFYVWLWGKIKSVEFPKMVDLGSVDIADAIRPCNETLVKLWEAIPSHGPPGHESSWYWRCFREDLPRDSNQVDVNTTTTVAPNEPTSTAGSGESSTEPGHQEPSSTDPETSDDSGVPGNEGVFLLPSQAGILAALLAAVGVGSMM
ncbi:hypothetical protein ASPVEDRAFT_52822 [Aspergillus versicolor CBS 583.65]|uniref:Receptor L-domain domain-containing protein n=1 Tax=Aspergillus versicolor CBS 583.65 TaxID=1036611 RepID=A0A1L9PKN3_ASPVE|nr:uncharacterized protein ASPVEDRAFT_52822 [Aspergillus versicolor CBS 583.65]OJJ02042.1 hypothetical protein ASPVEDRAFT_52822 [Aspergillus versicolor CBS 583.65]